jgi:hypothetical protein
MITHILKDGTTTIDISGHKVSKKDCPSAYAVMGTIRKEKQYGTDNSGSSQICGKRGRALSVPSTTLGAGSRGQSSL